MVDGTVLFKFIEEGFEIGGWMSLIGGGSLCFLIAAVVAFKDLIL